MSGEIWVLGATGRTGRAIAERLIARDDAVVLTGRDGARLRALHDELGGDRTRTVRAGSAAEAARAFAASAEPGAVVVNTIGPFTTTAPIVTSALPAGTGYVDLSNELPSFLAALGDGAAAAQERSATVVTGAGFGVLATESAVLRLCADRPAPQALRVDMMASFAAEAGTLGEALAASLVDSLSDGGRVYRGGRLGRSRLGSAPERLTTPDGDQVRSGSAPLGDLEAARRASGAADVVAAGSEVPTGLAIRAVLPLLTTLLRSTRVRALARRRLAAAKMKAAPMPRAASWARARGTWEDGTTRTVWLRAGDGMAFTADVAAEVAHRLAHGDGRPGAFTPGALFGPELAEAVGAVFVEGS